MNDVIVVFFFSVTIIILIVALQHLNPIADGFAPIIDLVDVKLTEFQVGLIPTLI